MVCLTLNHRQGGVLSLKTFLFYKDNSLKNYAAVFQGAF